MLRYLTWISRTKFNNYNWCILSNIEFNIDEINEELKTPRWIYGGRMKIEKDKINIIGGRGKKQLVRLFHLK